ncbi:hypothetical protein BC834DRAFT_981038 [Gloeopeniophorella convolvens]|nr:hypothetical protein BC834DRAFT_981038 [Gloeopeniophorella convolvens]
MEMEMLDAVDAPAETPADGVWNDDKDDKPTRAQLAWRRTAWAGAKLARFVPGFRWGGKRAWAVDGVLSDKVMDVVEDAGEGDDEDASEGDENDSEEIRALKRWVASPRARAAATTLCAHARRHARCCSSCRVHRAGARRQHLSSVAALVTSLCWTVVVPLPAIMELDGLAAAPAPLGDAARAAVASVVAHVRSHADALKVQTSRGNYLASLTVRRELVDFDNPQPQGCSMDDLILKLAR